MSLHRLTLAFVLAGSVLGCAKSGTYVLLTVERGAATPAGVTKIDLQFMLGGRSGSGTLAEKSGAAITFPAVTTLDITSGSGALEVTAIARDAGGTEVERGSAQGTVTSGATTRLTVTLGEIKTSDGGGVVDLTSANPEDLTATITDAGGGDMAVPDDLTPLPDLVRTTATLTVNKTGAAAGFATVSGGGITCGATCTVTVPLNTQITLTQAVTARKGAWFQQWSGACTGNGSCVVTLSDDLTVNAQFDLANYMFVTGTPFSGALGAISADVQSLADGICKTAASNASLPGTNWAAWISTTASSGSGAKNAKDKLTGARGWIRPDGLPFADQIPASTSDQVFYPPRVDETGAVIGSDQQVATATLGGNFSSPNCTDWSSASGSSLGGDAAAGSGGWSASYHGATCASVRFYCFGLDHVTPVAPVKAAGRVAFLSSPFTMTTTSNRATADAICASDAAANPTRIPPGTYQALLALTTEAASTRFKPPTYTSTLPWVRPDGVMVVAQPADLFNTTPTTDTLILAPIDQLASGGYGGRGEAWTGATDPNTMASGGSSCADWVSTGGANGVFAEDYLARLKFIPSFFDYSLQVNACTVAKPVYCLQVL